MTICNKMWFDRRKDAEAYIATTKAGRKKVPKAYANKKLKVYTCSVCGKYHITSKERQKGKRLKIRKKEIQKSK